jgi:hypothetical protein
VPVLKIHFGARKRFKTGSSEILAQRQNYTSVIYSTTVSVSIPPRRSRKKTADCPMRDRISVSSFPLSL